MVPICLQKSAHKLLILFAALPGGVNAYLFASRYNVAVGPVSGAIAIGTGLAIVTTSLLLSVL